MRDRRDEQAPGPQGVGGVDGLRDPAGIARAAAASEPAAAAAAAATTEAALASALAAGTIGPAEASVQLVSAVVASLRPPGADPAVWAAVEAEVAAVLAGDPTLGDLLRP